MARPTLASLQAIIDQQAITIETLRSEVETLRAQSIQPAKLFRTTPTKPAFVPRKNQIQCEAHGLVTPGKHGCPKCHCARVREACGAPVATA